MKVLKIICVIKPDNDRNLSKLLLSLNHSLSPTVYFISCNTEKLRKKLYETITEKSKRFKHIRIDLTPHLVYSLRDAINQFVPVEVRNSSTLTYVIHFTGISSSLFTSSEGQLKKSKLVEELNFERERLFHDYPFISILWMNPYFFNELFFKAGDLMSWTVDRYEFTDDSPDGITHEIPFKKPIERKGAIAERTERIKDLEDLLDRLDEEDRDQQKVMLEKMNAFLLLGREYMEAFRWKEAEENLCKAKHLIDKTLLDTYKQVEVNFYLGTFYYIVHQELKSMDHYTEALRIAEKINDNNIGAIHHQIGMVYEQQRHWEEALTNYKKAIERNEKRGNEYALGDTYHQIGMVYQKQRRWEEALTNYQKAIEWYKKTGNEYELGGTYHQIGAVYAEQHRWKEALTNYKKAIEWKEKTRNEYELGVTYHQIAIVYQHQHTWEKALTNCQKAVDWYEKTGNEYELGRSYHQMGRIYEEQHRWEEALTNYQKAIEWKEKAGNEYELGDTYHQIAIVYQHQRTWEKALTNHKKAIEWKEKTGNEYELGGTYHQIGRVYEEQRHWEKALTNYQKAIEWREKTGNEYALGSTYHQIGRVYEEQGLTNKAKEYFEVAVENMRKYNHPDFAVAERSLERIKTKLAAEKENSLKSIG